MILETISADKVDLCLTTVDKGKHIKYLIGWKAKDSTRYSYQYANATKSIRIARNRMIRMYKASINMEIVAKADTNDYSFLSK